MQPTPYNQSTPSKQSTQVEQRAVRIHQLTNGMVLVGEPTRRVQSAALTLLVPSGASNEPADRQGISSVLCDMVLRGAGSRDGRQLINALEILGVDRGESVGVSQTSFSAATLANNLDEAITIYADILQRPLLPKEQLESAKQICFHELRAIEDDPAQKLMVELRKRAYPEPWGRNSSGDYAGISASTHDDVVDHWACRFRPDNAILGIAGNFQWEPLVDRIENLFGDWKGAPLPSLAPSNQTERPPHVDHQSNQCHIGIAFPSVPYRHPDYLQAWAAIGILSSGMSSRLFTEVRERRGLCYTVFASLHTQLERACVFCYAGTTNERAQETLDVTFAELLRLGDGIKTSELDRLQARIKSSLIMQQESTSARSGAIARDWFHLGWVRPLEELGRLVDELTSASINAYLAEHPPRDFTFTTIGPLPLELPVGEA